MSAITIVGRISTNDRGYPSKDIKIFGADATLVTSLQKAFPGLQTSKDLVAGAVCKPLQMRQAVPMTLYTYYVYKNLSRNMKEKEDNILAEVTCYLTFLTGNNFSIVSVAKEPPGKFNDSQLTYTWTLQRV